MHGKGRQSRSKIRDHAQNRACHAYISPKVRVQTGEEEVHCNYFCVYVVLYSYVFHVIYFRNYVIDQCIMMVHGLIVWSVFGQCIILPNHRLTVLNFV